MADLLAKKPLSALLTEAKETGEHSLKRTLGVFQLTALGVGAIIGAGIFVSDLLGIATIRETAPIMTAIVMAGRTGGAYAAHIATMEGNEEIDAQTRRHERDAPAGQHRRTAQHRHVVHAGGPGEIDQPSGDGGFDCVFDGR